MAQLTESQPEVFGRSLSENDNRPLNASPGASDLSSEQYFGRGEFPGIRRPVRSCLWCIHIALGSACLILILAFLAAVPGLNILTLGYLLEPQRRVAVTGRLRDAFPLLKVAPAIGVACFFTLLFLIPVRIQSIRVSDAAVILSENDPVVKKMVSTLGLVQAATAAHLTLAIFCGGTAACFLRPIRNLKWVLSAIVSDTERQHLLERLEHLVRLLHPVRHLVIGLRGFLGAVCWLIIPSGLLVAYSAPERIGPLYGLGAFCGIVLLIPIMAWLPLLQVHQAATGSFRSIFDVRAVRHVIRHAPGSWMTATILTCLMTLPLYLTKIRLPPADAMFVLTPVYIILIYPARILVAWAYHRGMSADKAARWYWVWLCRILIVPVLAAYGTGLFLTPLVSELGKGAPLENPAFLGPVPYAQWHQSAE